MGRMLRVWDLVDSKEIARMEFDEELAGLVPLQGGRLVTSDNLGRLHWLKILG